MNGTLKWMPGDVEATQHPSTRSCYFPLYCTAVQQLADIKDVLNEKVGKQYGRRQPFTCH